MATRVFGLETEYAFSVVTRDSGGLSGCHDTAGLLGISRDTLPWLPDGGNGVFLQNGSRLYQDCGEHPELACPEVTSPDDGLRYLLAGDRIMGGLLDAYRRARCGSEPVLTKCNVSRHGTTWGQHESYLYRADTGLMRNQLVPFLASRVVFTGTGGFDPRTSGLRFVLSPRALHTVSEAGSTSTIERPLFHTKDESLASAGYHRLHILGESECSHISLWLKLATTALVVAMVDAGIRPVSGLGILNPVDALHAFACDLSCQTMAETSRGPMRALDIQRIYLQRAQEHARDGFMPPWATEACGRWAAVLELLERAPDSVATTLDWGIKHALYRRRLERHGFPAASLPVYTGVLDGLVQAALQTELRNQQLTLPMLLADSAPPLVRRTIRKLSRQELMPREITWDMVQGFLNAKDELFELETRFSQLGGDGIFDTLDREGVLTHEVPGVEDIDAAMTTPPADTRAKYRGLAVRETPAEARAALRCGWTDVVDMANGRRLDLGDPLAEHPQWELLSTPRGSNAHGDSADPWTEWGRYFEHRRGLEHSCRLEQVVGFLRRESR